MSSKEDIKLTVFKLLHEKGFEKTTYQAIADMSGYEKTLVQYHFPQKNLFITQYLDFLISAVMEYISDKSMHFNENGLSFIVHSKIYTHLLLHEDLIHNITIRVVQNREVLTYMQDFQEQSAINLLKVEPEFEKDLRYLLLFAQGGLFDLIYRMILGKRKCNVHNLLTLTLLTISPALKMTSEEVHRIMEKSLMYEDEVLHAVDQIIDSIKFQLGINIVSGEN